MMIPAGNTAKLVRVADPTDQDFRISEVCDKLKITQPTPVIVLAGAMTQRAGKTLAGVARAAFRTDAVIIDSGLGSGIEKFCARKQVPLIGVAPEQEVIYPRINPNVKKDNELTNGHTHFVLLGDGAATNAGPQAQATQGRGAAFHTKDKAPMFSWGDESLVKYELAKRVAAGRSRMGGTTPCKIVTVLVGDNPYCHKDVQRSLSMDIPVIVLEGSALCNAVALPAEREAQQQRTANNLSPAQQEALDLLNKANTFRCPDSSEDLASVVHLLLSISF